MPPRHQRRTCLDWGCSRHAKLPQVPQISAGLALPTEELLSPHQPHWNCQRVRLSNDSIEQNPFDTLPCKSGNKASLASPTGWILALTARRGATEPFARTEGLGPYWVQLHLGSQLLICREIGNLGTGTHFDGYAITAGENAYPEKPGQSGVVHGIVVICGSGLSQRRRLRNQPIGPQLWRAI
jgi:hypothetical protein